MHVVVVYGTRPEAIKIAQVVKALQRTQGVELTVVSTGQHREMLSGIERTLELRPDLDLQLMTARQHLNDLTARALGKLDETFARLDPDWVLVQGDTTTAMAAAMAAFHRRISIGHVEAGLRTGDLARPFPEEANRRIIDTLSSALFAPTARSAETLRAEGTPADRIYLTGNTVVDTLFAIAGDADPTYEDEVLVTLHRRESFGPTIRGLLEALRAVALDYPQLRWVYPVHRNPEVLGPAHEILADVPNFELHDPFDYRETIDRLLRCRFVVTDSGGLQEEAPSFGKPVLVARDTTERPEGVEAGVASLVGTRPDDLERALRELLEDSELHSKMAHRRSPYGDGRAAERIAAILTGQPWQPFTAD